MKLYRYNRITGYWVFVRECEPETAEQWLSVFQKDEPNETFRLSKCKPYSFNPRNPE